MNNDGGRIAELLALRRTTGQLGPIGMNELARLLQLALRPLARRLSESGSETDPWRRKAIGLSDSVESYWHEFFEQKILDPSWPDPTRYPTVGVPLIVVAFKNHLKDARKLRGIEFVPEDSVPAASAATALHEERDIENEEWTSNDVQQDEALQEGPATTTRLPQHYLRAADGFLKRNARVRWLPLLIETLMAPVFIDESEPVENKLAAQVLQVCPASITKYVRRAGIPSLNADRDHWNRSLIGGWIIKDCNIEEPAANRESVRLALEMLCRLNRERLRGSIHEN